MEIADTVPHDQSAAFSERCGDQDRIRLGPSVRPIREVDEVVRVAERQREGNEAPFGRPGGRGERMGYYPLGKYRVGPLVRVNKSTA